MQANILYSIAVKLPLHTPGVPGALHPFSVHFFTKSVLPNEALVFCTK